jgi:hypothetical protein
MSTLTITNVTAIQNGEVITDKFNASESIFKKLVLPKNEINNNITNKHARPDVYATGK